MIKKEAKKVARNKRHLKVRKLINGTKELPRLNIYRSNNNIVAQIIDDEKGNTLCSASTQDMKIKENNIEAAAKVGKELAKRAKSQKITKVVFDRGGYHYHGCVKSLAEAARKEGLKF